MKKTSPLAAALVAALFILPAFQSCKKGKDDPFISLRSRKARVAGEWTIDKMKEESIYTINSSYNGYSSTNTNTSNLELNGTSVILNETQFYSSVYGQSTSSSGGSGSGKGSVVFNKDGTFKIETEMNNLTITETGNSGYSYVYIKTRKKEGSGTWNFLGGVEKDFKNKERIILNFIEEKITSSLSSDVESESSTEHHTYDSGSYSQVWQITQLKNKEMIIKADQGGTGSYTSVYTSPAITESQSGTSSTTGISEMTLVQ